MNHSEPLFDLRSRLWRLAAAGAALALSGCVDTAVDLGARQASLQRPRLAARPGVSPRGASVALTSLEGAPEAVTARFSQIFAGVAESRDIATAPSAAAMYRVRGYLTATPGQGAARLSYVWDIFDRQGRRAQRLTDEVAAGGGGADPWSGLDDKALSEVAQRGAADLAAFLSNTPEAIAAANGEGAGLTVAAAQRAKPAAPEAARPGGFAEAK